MNQNNIPIIQPTVPSPGGDAEPEGEPSIQVISPSSESSPERHTKFTEGLPASASPIENQNPNFKNSQGKRSKIFQLPKAVRDKLNFMLRDGLQHQQVLDGLGDAAKGISPRNVSSWHASPAYQHWLLEQEWLEDLRDRQESACDLLNDFDAAKFNQAVLQLAVSRLFLSFRHLEDGDLNTQLGGNARAFANLVHALARACRETTTIEKYREACAKAVATELKQLNVDRDLSDREYELLVNKMDKIFKVARRPAAPKPNETGPQTVPLPLENNNHVP